MGSLRPRTRRRAAQASHLQYAHGPAGFTASSECQKFHPRLLSIVISTNPAFNPPIHHLSTHPLLLFLSPPSHLSSLSSLPSSPSARLSPAQRGVRLQPSSQGAPTQGHTEMSTMQWAAKVSPRSPVKGVRFGQGGAGEGLKPGLPASEPAL